MDPIGICCTNDCNDGSGGNTQMKCDTESSLLAPGQVAAVLSAIIQLGMRLKLLLSGLPMWVQKLFGCMNSTADNKTPVHQQLICQLDVTP